MWLKIFRYSFALLEIKELNIREQTQQHKYWQLLLEGLNPLPPNDWWHLFLMLMPFKWYRFLISPSLPWRKYGITSWFIDIWYNQLVYSHIIWPGCLKVRNMVDFTFLMSTIITCNYHCSRLALKWPKKFHNSFGQQCHCQGTSIRNSSNLCNI